MKKLFVLLTVIVTMAMAQAQEISRPQLETGRVAEAVGLYENGDNQKAIELLLQEIEVNKKNGYAYFYQAYMSYYSSLEELGLSEEEARKIYGPDFFFKTYDKAMKYIPKKDKFYHSLCYYYKALVYRNISEYDESNEMLDKGFKLNHDADFLQEKGQNYIYLEKYDMAQAMFVEANAIEQTSDSYVGLAVAYINLERYDEAIEAAQQAISYEDSGLPWALAQLARAYVAKGDIENAIEPAIDSYMLDPIEWISDMLDFFKEEKPELFVARLKIALVEYPNKEDVIKDFLMGVYYWELDDCRNAIKCAEDLNKMHPDYLYPYSILALSHIDLGEYDKALCVLDTLVKLDSTASSVHYFYHLAYYGQGMLDKSLESINQAIALDPERASIYQLRGKVYRYMGRIDDAIDDLTMALTLDSTESYYFLSRGVLLKQQNKNVAAAEDFYKVIELNSGLGGEMAYAYFYLGDKAKALETLVEGYAEKKIDDYNAACLYSLMGEKEMALRYLERALDKGFRNFNHIYLDEDFDNIRDLPEFKALIERYKN